MFTFLSNAFFSIACKIVASTTCDGAKGITGKLCKALSFVVCLYSIFLSKQMLNLLFSRNNYS